MTWRDQLTRAAAAARAGAVQAARLVSRAARGLWRVALRVWRSDLKRRLLRPVIVTARVALLAALLAGVTMLAGGAFVRRVAPTELVVRQHNWGEGAGVEARELPAGFHFGTPGGTSWHVIDSRTLYLRFGAAKDGNPLPALELRTKDDVELALSVNVPFRIRPGEAHRVVADGLKSTYRQNAKTLIEKVLLERFAALSSQEWFSTDARDAVAKEALAAINEALARVHCVAEAVLVTDATFPSLFEQKLAEIKLNGQKVATSEVLARRDQQKHVIDVETAAVERGESELAAQFDLQIEQAKIELERDAQALAAAAESYKASRRVEAENLHAKAVATGQLAVDQAEALRERLTNEALESTGGRLLLAKEAAGALKFKSIRIDGNRPDAPNPLDLDAFVALLVGDVAAMRD